MQYDEILAGNCFGQINVAPPAPSDKLISKEIKQKVNPSDEFHLPIEDLFNIARQYLKENQEIQLKYADNIRLIALLKQIKIGPWNASHTQNIGFLDVVGNDRKQAWISLGNLSKEKAMEEYVRLLLEQYSIFRIYLEKSHFQTGEENRTKEDDEARRILEKEAEKVRQYELEQVTKLEKKNKKREEFQRKQIQELLNQQTYLQFKAFAEQQYKDNRQAQEQLIQQLQEQHFQQYMQQVYQQQLLDQQELHRTKPNMEQQRQQQTENVNPTPLNMVPPSSLNIIIPPPVANINLSTIPSNITSLPPSSSSFNPTSTVSATSPTMNNPPPIPVNMPTPTSQFSPANTVTATSPTMINPPPIPVNLASPTATFNPINTATETLRTPTNVGMPTSFVSNVPLSSIPQMAPLGPAPVQLPPLVHPPPPPPDISPQSVTSSNVSIPEATIPVQTQFETLNLSSPSGPAPSDPAQSSNETGPSQETIDGQLVVSPVVDSTSEVLATGEEPKQDLPNIAPANMWTRKDLKEFKEQIRKEKDAVIKISSGETVTVRVPTHEDGQSVFWEFATDYYDLGFGVYFEWTKAQSNTVTVHVSDSSDEEEENEDGSNPEKKDIEKGSGSTNKPPKPRQDEIVPIYRRDCHEEVYAGSHPYPGQGIYLLKFDNSYSLWRSKTLYYRVYYSK